MKLEVNELTKEFGKTRALAGISFTIETGQIVGFVGPNGAGKTTTMKILATLDEPTSGDAVLDGISIIEEPERGRELIGYVPDSLPVHRDIRIHEYLDFFARAYGIPRARREDLIESLEDFTNLKGIREKMLGELSKGMKQRVCLARALIHDPQILLMDEPAAGLDPRARIELRELLRVLSGRGKAILISSHILSELAEICTAALIIEQGRMLKSGTLDQILTQDVKERVISVRTLERKEELCREILLMPNVLSSVVVGNDIEVGIDGDEKSSVSLLAELVKKGYPIVEFRPRRTDLETVFMNVTKGDVQ